MATIKKLQTLFSKKGMTPEERHEMIYHFTDGRTNSSRELTVEELEDLCNALQGVKKSRTQLMSECLKILELEGIHRPNEPLLEITENGAKPNPWGHLNRWMLKSSIYKKPLYQYSVTELGRLSSTPVQRNIGRVKDGPVEQTQAYFTNGAKVESLSSAWDSIADYCYN